MCHHLWAMTCAGSQSQISDFRFQISNQHRWSTAVFPCHDCCLYQRVTVKTVEIANGKKPCGPRFMIKFDIFIYLCIHFVFRYVKTYLLPDKRSKKKTRTVKDNLNPEFDEIVKVQAMLKFNARFKHKPKHYRIKRRVILPCLFQGLVGPHGPRLGPWTATIIPLFSEHPSLNEQLFARSQRCQLRKGTTVFRCSPDLIQFSTIFPTVSYRIRWATNTHLAVDRLERRSL